jgi:hypothetical protein
VIDPRDSARRVIAAHVASTASIACDAALCWRAMRSLAVVMLVMLGCGSKSEPEPPPPPPPPPEDKSLLDRAKSLGTDVVDKAKALSSDALDTGKALKQDLRGKLAIAKLDYDLAIDAIDEDEDDHEARVAGMKQLDVGSYRVGYARDAKHPLGDEYKWQFRVTWWVPATKRAVRLSIFTNHDLDEADLVDALLTIVPLAEKLVR